MILCDTLWRDFELIIVSKHVASAAFTLCIGRSGTEELGEIWRGNDASQLGRIRLDGVSGGYG